MHVNAAVISQYIPLHCYLDGLRGWRLLISSWVDTPLFIAFSKSSAKLNATLYKHNLGQQTTTNPKYIQV
jgi:hypothetical protein